MIYLTSRITSPNLLKSEPIQYRIRLCCRAIINSADNQHYISRGTQSLCSIYQTYHEAFEIEMQAALQFEDNQCANARRICGICILK